MKKFFALFTMVAILSGSIIGCSDDKGKAPAKDKDKPAATDKDKTTGKPTP